MRTYDCLLINPRSDYYSRAQKSAPYIPAGLLSIASAVKRAGASPFVLDMVTEDDPLRTLDAYLGGKNKVLLAGFTVMTAQHRHATEMSSYIKRRYPGTRIIWGGIHPSLFPEETLREGLADFVCHGEGEYVTGELLAALKGGADPASVKGIYLLSGGEAVFTGRREPNDLDKLPFLNLDLIDYSKYRGGTVFRGKETMPVNPGVLVSSVGCPYRCTFCVNANRRLAFGGYRAKSASRLADEIEFLIGKFGVDYLDFLDENFFVKRSHPEEFAREIKKRGLKFRWYTNMRADAFDRKLVDDELLEKLRAVGLYRLAVGAESGSQRILDKLKKDITVEQVLQSARRITEHELGATFSFMMGIPGETTDDLNATLRLIQRLRSFDGRVSVIGPQIFRPYPGGELYDECVSAYGYSPSPSVTDEAGGTDPLTGFESVENLPWIEDKRLIRKVAFYMEFVNINIDALRPSLLKRAALTALKGIANLRIRFRFWAFGFEMPLVLAYKKSGLGAVSRG